jgi:5-methylcytosine-specific restriction endonuclease McrA
VKKYSCAQLSDEILLRDLAAATARERCATAEVLALIGEVDSRKLYLPAGYPSMFAYCVGELQLSGDSALRRITAARAARRFPAIFEAVARGHLHLTAVSRLAPHLTEENAAELIGAASHRSTQEIEQLLAERFPQTDLLSWVAAPPSAELVSGRVDDPQVVAKSSSDPPQLVPRRVENRARMTPLSSQSVALQATLRASTHEKLCYAQELLGHQVPSGDIDRLLDKLLDLALPRLEQQKFGATPRPRSGRTRAASSRTIPVRVRRAVWERDQGRCTYVSESGHRCEARKPLEFDHVLAVARGGAATVEGIRLLCRAHNQHAAERTFGAGFMRHKRIAAAEARVAAKAARAQKAAKCRPAGEAREAAMAARAPKAASCRPAADDEKDVVPYLRALRFSPAEARRAAERCADLPPDATIEERVRTALMSIPVRGTRVVLAPEIASTMWLRSAGG